MPAQKFSKHGLTPNLKIKNSVDNDRVSIDEECKQQQFVIKKNSFEVKTANLQFSREVQLSSQKSSNQNFSQN